MIFCLTRHGLDVHFSVFDEPFLGMKMKLGLKLWGILSAAFFKPNRYNIWKNQKEITISKVGFSNVTVLQASHSWRRNTKWFIETRQNFRSIHNAMTIEKEKKKKWLWGKIDVKNICKSVTCRTTENAATFETLHGNLHGFAKHLVDIPNCDKKKSAVPQESSDI